MRISHHDRDKQSNRIGSNRDSNSVFIAIRGYLQLLDYKAFRNCVWLWLAALGYQHMLFLGRHHRRGRRASGGADFLVRVNDFSQAQIAVQIRHWRTPVTRQAIDELRGYLLRNGIASGMIISSSDFSRQARKAADSFPGRPIRLVSVDRFAASMMALNMGTKSFGQELGVDEGFFRTLRQLRFAVDPIRDSSIGLKMKRPAVSSASEATMLPSSPDGLGPVRSYIIGFLAILAFAFLLLRQIGALR